MQDTLAVELLLGCAVPCLTFTVFDNPYIALLMAILTLALIASMTS